MKATGIDPEALVDGAIRFAKTSGGIFLDMAIHDIDLMRWFLGCEATEVYAMGATFIGYATTEAWKTGKIVKIN